MKPRTLKIRCEKDTLRDFKNLVFDNEFKDYEAALRALILMAKNHPALLKESEVRYV